MNYSRLLKVYLHNGDSPNLFDLIVLDLLGNYNPPSERLTIRSMYNRIEKGLFEVYTRRDLDHRKALSDCTIFEAILRTALNKCFNRINEWLTTYFSHLQLRVEYDLKPMTFKYGSDKSKWSWERNLRLNVYSFDRNISRYNSTLNEARLSAISMLLLLASIYDNPALCDYKFLYLDDAFIGLDNANRRQILNLLVKEFENWQIFISTYDLTWYNAACELLGNNWLKFELFEGFASNNMIPLPIIVRRNDSMASALRHINDANSPDYPVAANYLRKTVEEMLITRFPTFTIRDDNYELIPSYKLANIISSINEFLSQTNDYNPQQASIRGYLSDIKSHLPTLLHPLSHYSAQTPVYKNELVEVINRLRLLDNTLKEFDYNNVCVLKEKNLVFVLTVKGSSGWNFNYQFNLCQNLYLFKVDADWILSSCTVQAVRYYGNEASGKYDDKPINKTNRLYDIMRYSSLQNAYDRILDFITKNLNLKDAIPTDYTESIVFINENRIPTKLSDVIVNKQKELIAKTTT